jgi:hypothetical protein
MCGKVGIDIGAGTVVDHTTVSISYSILFAQQPPKEWPYIFILSCVISSEFFVREYVLIRVHLWVSLTAGYFLSI